jgi:hypothetical protein
VHVARQGHDAVALRRRDLHDAHSRTARGLALERRSLPALDVRSMNAEQDDGDDDEPDQDDPRGDEDRVPARSVAVGAVLGRLVAGSAVG